MNSGLWLQNQKRREGLREGSCLILGNALSQETHMLTKQERKSVIGKGCLGRMKQSKGIQNYSAT